MGFISWMADKLGIGDSKKKKKKKTTSKGVTSVVKDMSHVSKDAATINSKSTSAKQKQAARNRISSYKSGNDVYKTGKVYQSDQNRSSRVSGQSKKTTTKKRDERSTFEKFSQSQLKSIKAGAAKTNTPKQDTKKLTNAYDAYKKRLESDRAKKKAEEEKKERQELSKNSLVQMQKSQQETLSKLRAERKKLKEGNLAKADPQKEIDKLNKEIRAVKNDRKFAKSYKKEQGEKAKKQLDKQLKSMSLPGTQETKKKVEQKAEEEKKRKQEVLDKVYNRRVDKREDNSKMSDTEKASIYTDPVRAAAARSGNPKTVYTKKQREEMRKSVQKGLDKGQFGAGLLQGSMLGGDLYDAVEKQYGVKLDRTKYNKSTSAKVGEAVGMLAMSAVPGATTEAAAAKSLTKALAKVTGKKATSKAAKAAATIAAESAASLPMNVADAAKNSEDGKTFAKNLAENVALDAGLNGVMEGASALLKNTAKSKAGQALVKMGKGENLTQQEQDAFNKVVSRAAAKSATNKKLNKLEEVVLQTAQNRNTKKNLTSVAEGRSLKAGNKVETKKYLDTKQKSLRYQASSQALPDDSYLSADRLSTTNISESSVKSNTSEKKIGDTVTEKDFSEPVDLENDPHVRDILADPDGKVTKETSSFVKKFTEVKDIARQKTVDSLQGVEKMGRKLGGEQGKTLVAQASALRRSGEKATFNLLQKQTDFNNHVIGKGGFEILAPIRKQGKEVYDDFNAYLFHRLNVDRHKNGKTLWGENVVSPEKSRQIIKQFDEKYPDFKGAADETVQFFRNQNTVRVQSGLISKYQKDLLEELYENYVPAYRNIDKRAAAVDADGIRVDTGIRRAKGGDQAILPIHEQMAYATQRTWKAAELNETIRQIAKAQGVDTKHLAKEITDSAEPEDALEEMLNHSVFFEGKNGESVKAIYFDKGKAKEVRISKLVYDGLKKWAPSDKHAMLDSGSFDRLLTGFEDAAKAFNNTTAGKGLIKFNDLFKGLITSYNPFFLIRNGLKDMQDIPVNSSSLSGFIKNMPKAYKAMMKSLGGEKDPLWETYLAAGVRYSGIIDPKTALKPDSKLSKVNPLRLLENANMAVESYPRFTEFCNILDQMGVKDIKNATREQIERAAKGAADVTCDFGRTGSLTAPVNRSAVPFLNASIQGADKLWRVLSGQKGFRGYVALAGKLAALGAAPAIAQEVIYANDPDYQQLNARDRAGNYFIKNADGTFWKIPRGRTISTLINPAQQAARAFVGNDKMSFDEFKEKLFTDLAPVNPEDSFILKQMFNTYANQTWYGGTIEGWSDQYNDDGTEKLKIERYDPNTSKIGMALSKKQKELLTKVFGEEKAEELTMSPMKWDYLIDSYGGIASDVALSATKIGKTKGWWSETFERNFKKDPVYSNNLSARYYEKMDEIKAAAEKKDATMEEKARAKMLGSTSGNLSDLKDLQDRIRFDKDMSLKEKSRIDRELQKQINELYRNGVSDAAVKAFDDFVAKNKDKYMTEKGLAKAAQQAHEKVTHATVRAMDTLYKYGGMKAVLKNKSHYIDDGEKVAFKFSDDKTIGKIYKNYKESGGSDEKFYSLYREMTKHNKEEGIGTNAKYGNLAAVCIRTGTYSDKEKKQLRKAFGVSEDSSQMVNEYFKLGGTKEEYLKAASLAENGSNSLRDRQKGGKTTDYNFDAPFKARSLADAKLPDRAYRIIDSAERGRRAEFYINNSRGLAHYNISLKTLQELDNKVRKGADGYNTKEGVESVLDGTDYNREEKALIWEALYGLSYRTENPYGSIRDYSLKSDVGIDTSGGWKNYGSGYRRYYGGGYRRYGGYGRSYGRTGGSGGSGSSDTEEMSEFEKYTSDLLASIQAGDIEAAKMNYGSRKLKQKYGDSYSKAVAKLLAKQVFKS